MKYKQSVFNYSYRKKPDEMVVYNTFSKALFVLDDGEFDQFEALSFTGEEPFRSLVENGLLVKDDEDELQFLKYFHYKTKFANKILFLTIAPTLDCNFVCPYCYENRRPGRMSEEVQKGILAYLNDALEGGIKGINITWYGGEPLLCFDIVEYLSAEIYELCVGNDCRLKMDIVTNGYLLDETVVEKIDRLGITKVQITVDGLKKHHDMRRPLRGGQGSFEKIMSNLSLFEDSPLSVLIRMNVDNQNCDDFKFLKEKIDSLNNSNIRAYASPVENINKDTVNEISDFMSTREFEAFASKACDEGDWSDDDFSVMDDRYCFCTSETENCYVVDEIGNFYKCWDEVGREEYACFNVLTPEKMNYNQIVKFLANDPFSDSKCSKCVFLPLCFGGCKFQKAHLNKSVCGFTDDSMKKYIETTFFK
ncbi:MAG: radical SAM protein [Eubacteriaceae bacterium]